MDAEITSDVARVGDRITARLAAPARTEDKTLLPAGTIVEGERHLPSGRTAQVEGTMAAYAKKQTGKDAGALLGKVLGRECITSKIAL